MDEALVVEQENDLPEANVCSPERIHQKNVLPLHNKARNRTASTDLSNKVMKHLTTIADIEQTIEDYRLCLFFIKAPDCGVCNVMLDKVGKLAETFPTLCSFYTDIIEEPLIAGRFLVYSGPTVLLLMEGKEVYRGVQFIYLEELKQTVDRYMTLSKDE